MKKKPDNFWDDYRNIRISWIGSDVKIQDPKGNCGLTGVTKRSAGRFCANIRIHRRHVGLGTFDSAEEASEAYLKAKKAYSESKNNRHASWDSLVAEIRKAISEGE